MMAYETVESIMQRTGLDRKRVYLIIRKGIAQGTVRCLPLEERYEIEELPTDAEIEAEFEAHMDRIHSKAGIFS